MTARANRPNYGEPIGTVDDEGRVVLNYQMNVFLDELMLEAGRGDDAASQPFSSSVLAMARISEQEDSTVNESTVLALISEIGILRQQITDLENQVYAYQTFPQ